MSESPPRRALFVGSLKSPPASLALAFRDELAVVQKLADESF